MKLVLLFTRLCIRSFKNGKMRIWLRSLVLSIWTLNMAFCTLSAQNSPLPNPIPCNSALPIRDNNCPEALPTGDPDEFDIQVSNAPGNELGTDVYLKEVRLMIRHTWVGDLDISLVSPRGRTVVLMTDVGGGDDDLGEYNGFDCKGYMSFSITSCVPIESGFPPFTDGPYLPEESLFRFNDGRTDPNGIWTLQICDDVIEDAGTLEYFELVFEPIQCLPLQETRIAKVDTTTVIVDWVPTENCGPIILEYGPPGFRPGTTFARGQGEVVRIDACAPFALERLQPDTYYEIYLRNYCESSGGFSTNSCPLLVKTGCLPAPPSLSTNFDDQEICGYTCGLACDIEGVWRNDQENDDFDWLVASGNTPTNGTGPTEDVSGDGNYIYIEASGTFPCGAGGEAYLLSNCIQFNKKGTDTCHLSFNYHMQGFQVGQLRLDVSEDGGFNWQSIWERSGPQGNNWNKVYLSLADFEEGANLRFRFAAVKGNGSKGDMAIDEIVFYGSEDLGSPDQAFYVDADGDGYGDPSDFITSCAAVIPDGYADNADDCDDSDPNINPAAPEIPCDGIDNNCNGLADDADLPVPLVQGDTVCSGEQAMICAVPSNPDNFILWYGSEEGDDIVGPLGTCFFPELPLNNSPSPQVYTFYAEELGLGCRSVERAPVSVIVNPNPQLMLDEDPSVCQGQFLDVNSVPIEDANFTGGILSFSDIFPFTDQQLLDTNIVDPLEQSTVYFRMTSPEGCVDQDSFSIQQSAGPVLSFSPAPDFGLCNEATQLVRVSVSEGSGPYEYLWSNGEQSDSILLQAPAQQGEILQVGVEVTDADGCVSTDTVQVSSSDGLLGVQRSVRSVSQCGGADGQITLTPLSGAPPYLYTWSGSSGMAGDSLVNAASFELDNLSQGAYDITITDGSSSSCEFVVRSVLVNGPDAVLNPPLVQEVSCAGASDGEICIDVELGVNPHFLWSTGDTTSCIDSLPGGLYSVTVTEGNCQNVIENIVIEEAEPIRLVFDQTAPACADSQDGAVGLSVFGGKLPISYQWSNRQTASSLSNIGVGQYKVTVTDDNGCQSMDSVLLRAPEPLRIFLDSKQDISCFGDTDGSIRVSTVGGRGPYQYEWSNGVLSPLVQQLTRGDYTITITDFNGCFKTETYSIREPDVLDIQLEEMIQPLCIGDTTGRIAVSVSGGTRPYTYQWNNGGQDSVLQSLGVGLYELVVSDASGCFSDTLFIELTATSVLDLNATINAPDCVGKENGRIELQPNGTAPLSYNWGNGENGNIRNNLGVGNYPLTITDGDGCIYDTTIVVIAPQAIELEVDLRPPKCSGGSDGLISLNVDGNLTAPISYRWDDGNTQKNRSGLMDGSYVLTITDGNACQLIADTLVLESPEELTASVLEVGPIKCKGEATGFIELQTSGGVPPYEFNWDNLEQNTESVFDIPAGSYRVQVQDANDCSIETTVSLQEPELLDVAVDLNVGDVCSGDTTNLLRAEVEGGTPPYRYLWNNGLETNSIQNVVSGDYSVEVADANNCVEAAPTIKVKDASIQLRLDSFYVKDVSCNGAKDGILTARVSGGRAPYSYHFSNNFRLTTSADSLSATGLPVARNYRVTITDRNGCVVVSDNKGISQPAILSVSLKDIRPVTCVNGSDGMITVNASGGTGPYNFIWQNEAGDTVSVEENLMNVGTGIYDLSMVDQNGCEESLSGIRLGTSADAIQIVDSLTQVFSPLCREGDEGAIVLTIRGGQPPYEYNWSNGSNQEDLNSLAAGTYALTVTDANNCSESFPAFQVTEPDVPVLEPSLRTTDVSCFGEDDGSAFAQVLGGVPPYNYAWQLEDSPIGGNSDTLRNLTAGNYSIAVTDRNECRKELSFTLIEPEELAVQINLIPPLDTMESTILQAIVMGGTPDFNFSWSTGENTDRVTAVDGSNFSVSITDANGCTAQDTVFLTSVFESELLTQVKVFPNPASGQAYIQVELAHRASLELELLDLSGRRLIRQPASKGKSHQFQLDLSGLKSGEYILRLKNARGLIYSGLLIVVE
jgi:subtilisin-like proprotein convertase family protein